MPGVCTDRTVRRRVVAGVDPALPSSSALLWAQSIACALDAAVDAVAVWDITSAMAADWGSGSGARCGSRPGHSPKRRGGVAT